MAQPLTSDNIVQMATGSFNATGGDATLPAAVTAGSTVVIAVAAPKLVTDGNFQVTSDDTAFEPVGGVLAAGDTVDYAYPTVWARRNLSGGQTAFGLTPKNNGSATARPVTWWIAEVTGLGTDPLGTGNLSWYANKPAGGSTNAVADTLSIASNPAANSPPGCYTSLGLALYAARSNDATTPVFSSYADGWYELGQVGRTDSGTGFGMAVAYKSVYTTDVQSSSAAVSTLSDCAADVTCLYADGASYAPVIQVMTGAEFGSMTGAAVTNTGNGQIFDTATATVTCSTTQKRTGNYSQKYASTAAAANDTWSAKLGDMTGRALCARLNVFFDTSLPGVDVELASVDVASTKVGTLTYRTASQKLEVKVGTGTAILSDTTVVAGQWIGIDLRYDPRGIANAQHLCDWQVDYNADPADTTGPVPQTQAVGAGTSAGTVTAFRKGWTQSITATVYMDDVAVSRVWGVYPIGDLRIRPLRVDPAGTPAIRGTTANFNVFTANGTMSAWNAANARNALLDVPPTIGAAASGVAQVTAAFNDWADFPLETYDAAGNGEAIRALCVYAAGWAAGTQAAGISLAASDGRSVPDVSGGWAASTDANWDTTSQQWVHWQYLRSGDTLAYLPIPQANLDALVASVGGSLDATPDIGVHCFLAEVATAPLATGPVASGESDTFRLYAMVDEVDSKIPALIATTPAGTRGATVTWAIRGADQTPQYVGPGTVQTFYTGAESVEDVTLIVFTPDATP